jgi:hypothetical protein
MCRDAVARAPRRAAVRTASDTTAAIERLHRLSALLPPFGSPSPQKTLGATRAHFTSEPAADADAADDDADAETVSPVRASRGGQQPGPVSPSTVEMQAYVDGHRRRLQAAIGLYTPTPSTPLGHSSACTSAPTAVPASDARAVAAAMNELRVDVPQSVDLQERVARRQQRRQPGPPAEPDGAAAPASELAVRVDEQPPHGVEEEAAAAAVN